MCPVRRVADASAGPNALGILVPPGPQTFLILRPRSLAWDLVLMRDDGITFAEQSRPQAQASAQCLLGIFEDGIEGDPFEAAELPDGRLWLRVRLRSFLFVLCRRAPGEPYRPHLFDHMNAAQTIADLLDSYLRPPAGAILEVYCNAHNFHT